MVAFCLQWVGKMAAIDNIEEGSDTVSEQENKALVRRYMEEVHNKGNLDAVEEFFAVDFVDQQRLSRYSTRSEWDEANSYYDPHRFCQHRRQY